MEVQFKNPHPVISVILQRFRENSKPGKRSDKFKVGLAIEGGTMRGVVSAGILVALGRLGLRDCFDVVYGTSAGAVNGAWFLANQLDSAIGNYYRSLNNFSFINPFRIFIKRPMLSIDFLEEKVDEKYSLDFEEIKKSGVVLKILAVRVDKKDGDPLILLSDFKDKNDLLNALHAGVNVPFVAGKPYEYRNMQLWDGGLIERVPLPTAIKDGCTHVLTLINEPEDLKHNLGRVRKAIIMRYLKKYSPHLVPFYDASYETWDRAIEQALEKQKSKDGPPFVSLIALAPGSKNVNGLEIRRKVLINGAKRGMYAVLRVFGIEGVRVEEELTFTDEAGEMIDSKSCLLAVDKNKN